MPKANSEKVNLLAAERRGIFLPATKSSLAASSPPLAAGHSRRREVEKKPLKATKKRAPKKAPEILKKSAYFEGVGRRKTAKARARLFLNGNDFLVNGKDYQQYFSVLALQKMARSPLEELSKELHEKSFGVKIVVRSGGLNSQAEAVRLAISRALMKFNPESCKKIRKLGFLTRDPRMRERKKFGLKRARRAPQWQKR